MIARLTRSWELSTEHAESSYGQPVLVHRASGGEAYGPGDIVPYPRYGYMLASDAVRILARTARLDDEGLGLVERFTGAASPR
jgi:hypothetical protein